MRTLIFRPIALAAALLRPRHDRAARREAEVRYRTLVEQLPLSGRPLEIEYRFRATDGIESSVGKGTRLEATLPWKSRALEPVT